MKKKMKNDRTDAVFGEIMSGLSETAAHLAGTTDAKEFRIHIPEAIDVRAIRKSLKMSQDTFAEHFGFSAARVRDWEQGRSCPDQAVRAYLRVIEEEPEVVERVLTAA
jgi:putative transcriptional regulator